MRRPLSLRVRILLSCLACMVGAMLIQLTLFTRSSTQIISAQVETINANTQGTLAAEDRRSSEFRTHIRIGRRFILRG